MIMTDNSRMPFGKYKGVEMKEVPAEYLLELLRTGYKGKVKPHVVSSVLSYIKGMYDVLEVESSQFFPIPEVNEDDLIEVDNSIDFDIFEQE
jgi:uncharacterized protein (DUF3820 family)